MNRVVGRAPSLVERRAAGWMTEVGEVVTRVSVCGPGSFRFEVVAPQGQPFVFRSLGEVAMAVYLADGRFSPESVTSGEIVELICAGGARGGYEGGEQAAGPRAGRSRRYRDALTVAARIVWLTSSPLGYPDFPQWHPAWRVNELEDGPRHTPAPAASVTRDRADVRVAAGVGDVTVPAPRAELAGSAGFAVLGVA